MYKLLYSNYIKWPSVAGPLRPNSHYITTFSVLQDGHRDCWQLGQVSVFILIGVCPQEHFSQRLASARPPTWYESEGLTQDQMNFVFFLLFEGGYPRNISSVNRYRPKIRLLPPNLSSGLITLVTDHAVPVWQVSAVRKTRFNYVGHDCRTHTIGRKSPIIEWDEAI